MVGSKGWGVRGGRTRRDLYSFVFGNFEKEPLFPKPKQSFPCKRSNKAKFCASSVEFLCCERAFSPSTEEKEPVSGPIMMAANNHGTPAKGQVLCCDLHIISDLALTALRARSINTPI